MTTWTELAPKPKPLPSGMKWHVFLSYRSVNRAWVINLYDVLRTHGFEVFLDQLVLKPTDPLVRTLQDNLQNSQSAILVWSKDAAASTWVESEFDMMTTLEKESSDFHLVPVRLDNEPLPLWVKPYIHVDFREYPDGPNGGELLRLVHALTGQPLTEPAARFASEQDETARETMARVRAAIAADNRDLLRNAPQSDDIVWSTSSATGCAAAEGLTKLGDDEGAIELLDTLSQRFPRSIRPRQLKALAHARLGGAENLVLAQDILGTLYEAGHRDPETVGIYARTFKDRYANSGNLVFLGRARELYLEGFRSGPDDYYNGINAASVGVILGTEEDLALATEVASEVQDLVGTEPVQGDYWRTATIGEVFLIRRNYEDAGRLYQAAVDTAPTEVGSHESTWKQACRLLDKLGSEESERALVLKPFAHLDLECSDVVSG